MYVTLCCTESQWLRFKNIKIKALIKLFDFTVYLEISVTRKKADYINSACYSILIIKSRWSYLACPLTPGYARYHQWIHMLSSWHQYLMFPQTPAATQKGSKDILSMSSYMFTDSDYQGCQKNEFINKSLNAYILINIRINMELICNTDTNSAAFAPVSWRVTSHGKAADSPALNSSPH